MSAPITRAIRKTVRIAALSSFFAALLALTLGSIHQIFTVVIISLLEMRNLAKITLLGALLAALVPLGYMIVYACILCRIVARKIRGSSRGGD
jgi:hypothetical protein